MKGPALSNRAGDYRRLAGYIKQSWLESGSVYGYRKITLDLRDLGETCGKDRVYKIMKAKGLRSQTCYKRRQVKYGRPSVIVPNKLQQHFTAEQPNEVWVVEITYIRTHEGWLYLAAVLDLYSRQFVGWAMSSRIDSELELNALLIAVWRRKPTDEVIIHSDQGVQYSNHDRQAFLKEHHLVASMSRRGNCYDNALAESFFQFLKLDRIRRKIYLTGKEARSDIFNYIEMF